MQMYLLGFPLWLLFVVLVLGGAVTAAFVSWHLGRRVRTPPADPGVALAIFQTIGAVFGVTLAFTISAVYAEFEAAGANVSEESNAIGTLYRLVQQLPAAERAAWQRGVREYVQQVVEQEWPLMAQGQRSTRAGAALNDLWRLQHALPATVPSTRVYEQLRELTDRRRHRLRDSHTQLAPLMWLMLLGGGITTVGVCCFIRSGNDRSQALMTGVLAAVIGLGLLVVMALDLPFSGSMHVLPDAIGTALEGWPHG